MNLQLHLNEGWPKKRMLADRGACYPSSAQHRRERMDDRKGQEHFCGEKFALLNMSKNASSV